MNREGLVVGRVIPNALSRRVHRTARVGCTRAGAIFGAALLWFTGVAPARAHDPYEITVLTTVKRDALEMAIAMAPSTARSVASGGRETSGFSPADFEKLKPQLEACAAKLFSISVDDKLIGLHRVTVSLGRENDVEFHLSYPLTPTDRVRFRALLVETLPRGYGAELTAVGLGEMLGQKLLTTDDPILDIKLPPPAASPPRST